MRALVVLLVVLGGAVAYATPAGYDHLVHARNLDVKGHDPLPCSRCHVAQKGKLAGKPGHAACFGTGCHGETPAKLRRGKKLAFDDRASVCKACHDEGSTAVAYPPYTIDPDFNISFGHEQHAAAACTLCHDMRARPAKRAPHERCAGCHDGTKASAMTQCASCHPQAVGNPEPPHLAVVHDSVTATFSHPAHAVRSSAGKDCTTCHAAIKGTNDTELPRPTMQSCGASQCHDGKAAFATTGPCTRCHTQVPARYDVFRDADEARFEHGGPHARVVADRTCAGCHALGPRGDTIVAGHDACAGCHADDFADRKPKKCAACHSANEPWRHLTADRAPADRTEFGVSIDHARHPQPCVHCHSLRTSAAQLRPPRGHAACTGAGCHAAGTGPSPTLEACVSCHRPGLAAAREQARLTAPWSVRASFEHATHQVECKTCHTSLAGDDLLKLPTPAKATCLPCHDAGKAAFKLTGTTCTRCHPSSPQTNP
jgi:c(7)-type cytochrome triheme protein